MKLPAIAVSALSLIFVLPAPAQAQAQTTFTDPANLRGERVSPRTGRELPIEGGEGNDALGLQQLLRKLQTRASLMLIVAHPDDEDGGMLTLYSRGLGARVADLSLTRGEGGQNAVTGDFEDALGLIRTQELLAADRYSGTDQFFGTEVDFGFSKTKEESFRKWTHDRVLYDAVRAVRLYRPLVIAAVFIGGVTDGHGQHQVSGEIAQEVFKAAADPAVFPELTREGILPWAPLKVYARVPSFAITGKGLFDYATNQYVAPTFTNYVTGVTTSTPPTPDVVIHEGETDPLLTTCAAHAADLSPSLRSSFRSEAKDSAVPARAATSCKPLSYVQFARIGLGLQRTQIGPGVRLATPGAFDVGYHLYGSRLCGAPKTVLSPEAKRRGESCISPTPATSSANAAAPQTASFFDGVDTSVMGIATLAPGAPGALRTGLETLNDGLTAVAKAFSPQNPAALAPLLVQTQHQLGALLDLLEKTSFAGRPDVLHELRIKQVQLNDALALALGLQLRASAATPSDDVLRGSAVPVATELRSRAQEPVGIVSEAVEGAGNGRAEKLLAIDTEPAVTEAHPLREQLQATPTLTGAVTRPYFFRTDVEQPVYQLLDPALRDAPATPPPLTAWATLRYHQTEIELGRIVEAQDQAVNVVPAASITLAAHAAVLPQDDPSLLVHFEVSPPKTPVHSQLTGHWEVTSQPGAAAEATGRRQLRIVPPTGPRSPAVLHLVTPLPDGQPVHEGYRAVGYPGLPRTNFYVAADLRVVPIGLKLPTHHRIGYLPGTGDAVADNLRSVGFEVTPLTVADLTSEHLARFDIVILGVRTYNAHPDLHGAPTAALLQFAREGGNVIVQYQTAEFTAADAPYPLSLGNAEKVVDETTPVRLLDSAAPALTTPNRITEADFHGWIEERGHGFLQSWDPRYTALTETHDPGAPAEGIAPQLPQRGGLITTQLGRGHWTYCAFALYRQLPEAVPGAFRLFTNLVGLAGQ